MAILSAIVENASKLKNVLKSLDFFDKKYARFRASKEGFYLDIERDGIIFTLGLRPEWFLFFTFTEEDGIAWPFTFDFDQFLTSVRDVEDTHLIEFVVVNTAKDVVVFAMSVFDHAGDHIVEKLFATIPSSYRLNEVRTLDDVNTMLRPKAKLFSADLAIRLLWRSIKDCNPVHVFLTNHTVNMRTRIRRPSLLFDNILGQSCSIICFNNPCAMIFTSLKLYKAPYLQRALTGTAVEAIELIYPPWPGQILRNVTLRLWFSWNAFLDLEFSSNCIVRPEIGVNHCIGCAICLPAAASFCKD